MMEGPGADSEEKHEPVSDIDTAVVVVGLKALDPEWPIREAIDPNVWSGSALQDSLEHVPLGYFPKSVAPALMSEGCCVQFTAP